MEVEDEDAILERLFFKKYGRGLPEKEKEKEKDNEVDQIKFVIDLTDEDEMEVATENVPAVAIVKTEPIEIANVINVVNVASVSNVANVASVNNFAKAKSVYNESGIRVSRRLELIKLAKARKAINEFGRSLRKKDVIPEKEAPLAASSNVIADNDTDMAEDVSANPVGPVKTYEQVMAEIDAAIEDNTE
jgi:hypothetical protein